MKINSEVKYRIVKLEIMNRCNMACVNCSRMCGPAPSDEMMTVDQIKKFVKETFEQNWKWNEILLFGGEPTLHPNLLEMVEVLNTYREKDPTVKLLINSNHIRQDVIKSLPKYVGLRGWLKTSNFQKGHEAVNKAPIDVGHSLVFENNPCLAHDSCGFSLSKYGYYFNGSCYTIDRILGFDIGVKTLKEVLDSKFKLLDDQQAILCKYCGRALPAKDKKSDTQITSPFWAKTFTEYAAHKPTLTLY